jgi:hypothetical protein
MMLSGEALEEPFAGEFFNLFESSRFVEQVRRTVNDRDFGGPPYPRRRR